MKTKSLSDTFNEYLSDIIDGIAPRWTLFSNLININNPTQKALSAVTVIDSRTEREIGYGTKFEYKADIGEREAIVSEGNLKLLGLEVGDMIDMHYDLNLLMKMYVQMSD